MINTKATPKHIESIESYKKFLEKWDMWDFAYYDGSEYYFLNQYFSIIKRISGYLILDRKGEVIPFHRAKDIFKYLVIYNTMMSQGISEILPQMKKNMSPFREKVQLLTKHREVFYNLSSADTVASVDRIINETNITLENPKVLNDIYYTMADYQQEIMKVKGYFDQELLEKVRLTFTRYGEVMYNYGMRERSLNKDYDIVVNSLNNLKGKISAYDRRYIKHLLVSAKQSNQGTLEKSMRQFEHDDEGNRVFIDQMRIRESIAEKVEKQGLKYFEEKMVIQLRNPK